jgi:hypothetical protein
MTSSVTSPACFLALRLEVDGSISVGYRCGLPPLLCVIRLRVQLRIRTYSCALAMMVAVNALSIGAHAQTEPAASIALDFRAPALRGCPSRGEFEQLVASRMGYAPFDERGEMRIVVEIAGVSPNAMVGSIRLIDAHGAAAGRREISTPSHCADLAESLAMAVSILVEEFRAAETEAAAESESAAEPAAESESAAATESAAVTESAAATESESAAATESATESAPHSEGVPSEPVGVALGVAFLGEVGVAPDPTLGARVSGGVRYSFLEIALELSLSTQVATARLGSSDRINVIGYYADLAVCGHLAPVGACLLGGGGALQATVQTVASPRAQTSAMGFVGARIFGVIPLGDVVRIRPFVEVWAVLVRTVVLVEGAAVWEAEPIAGRLGLELAFDFR